MTAIAVVAGFATAERKSVTVITTNAGASDAVIAASSSRRVSYDKAATRGQGNGVTCAVQDAHDHEPAFVMNVVNCVVAAESGA